MTGAWEVRKEGGVETEEAERQRKRKARSVFGPAIVTESLGKK